MDFPAVDLVHDAGLIGQVDDGGPTLVLGSYIGIPQIVVVGRLPVLLVAVEKTSSGWLAQSGHLVRLRSAVFRFLGPVSVGVVDLLLDHVLRQELHVVVVLVDVVAGSASEQVLYIF